MARVDQGVLIAFCLAVGEAQIATKILTAQGRLLPATGGSPPRLHPMVKRLDDALTRIKALAAELGLSPAARSRMVAPPAVGAGDPLDQLDRKREAWQAKFRARAHDAG